MYRRPMPSAQCTEKMPTKMYKRLYCQAMYTCTAYMYGICTSEKAEDRRTEITDCTITDHHIRRTALSNHQRALGMGRLRCGARLNVPCTKRCTIQKDNPIVYRTKIDRLPFQVVQNKI